MFQELSVTLSEFLHNVFILFYRSTEAEASSSRSGEDREETIIDEHSSERTHGVTATLFALANGSVRYASRTRNPFN